MQDRFKYRVWNNKKRKYEEDEFDYFICCTPGVVYESHASVFDDLTEAEEGHYTLEQCTGLKDKNGKLIYEGDIVKQTGGMYDYLFVVEWKHDGFRLPQKENWSDGKCWGEFKFTYEIIGNVHENVELLED